MIEHEDDLPDDDEDALWDISERIGPLEPATLDAAEMEESAASGRTDCSKSYRVRRFPADRATAPPTARPRRCH